MGAPQFALDAIQTSKYYPVNESKFDALFDAIARTLPKSRNGVISVDLSNIGPYAKVFGRDFAKSLIALSDMLWREKENATTKYAWTFKTPDELRNLYVYIR